MFELCDGTSILVRLPRHGDHDFTEVKHRHMRYHACEKEHAIGML